MRAQKKRYLAQGIERVDSWATDAHKWLNVPFDSGIVIVTDRAAHKAAMTTSASYIAPQQQLRDQIDFNPEWSRRARGVENLVDRCCQFCLDIVTGIGALEGAHIVHHPELNQGLVSFLAPNPNATLEDHDIYTDMIIAKINASGDAFFSGSVWKGRRVMRVSVVNWRTNAHDVRRAIKSARVALAR